MPKVHIGSVILGLLIGVLLYHFSKSRIAARA